MKTRSGFVSNSSSSSFIVAFDKKPETVEELQRMLFGDEKHYSDPYDSRSWPARTVAETVFQDMQKQGPLDREALEAAMEGVEVQDPEWHAAFEKFLKCQGPYSNADYEKLNKTTLIAKNRVLDRWNKDNPGKLFYEFEYSDNEGFYSSALEHGDLFADMSHLKISHH